MNNILSQIQHFNSDAQINQLHMMYERNSLLNSLSVSRREISHSMFIAELLKENSFHGTGTKPLQLFLETILHRAIKQKTRLIDTGKEVMFPTLKSAILARNIDISDIEVSTEEGFSDKDGNSGKVDILVSCRVRPLKREENNKEVEFINIIIENKVYSKEQDDQTGKYYKHFNAFLKNRASERVDVTTRKGGPRSLYNLYVYLVPNSPSEIESIKTPVCKCKEYIQICYQDILDYILDPLLNCVDLSQRGRFFIDEYRRSLGMSFENVESLSCNGGKKTRMKVNTAIMAMGRVERKELRECWETHKQLFVSAINEINRLDDEENDNEENDNGKNNSNKRTLYEYKGQPFSMNRLVQALILDHLSDYTLEEMNEIFKDIVGRIISTKINKSYFEEKSEICTKDNKSVYIFQQWSENGPYKFCRFCEKVKAVWGCEIQEYKKLIPSPEESMLLVDFYKKYEKLITTIMEVMKYEDGDNLDDDIKALLKRKNSHRDRSKYSVTLHNNNQIVRNLSRGRLVLTILQDYVESVSISKDDLIEVFQLPQNALKEYDPSKKPGYTGFFDRDVDILYLDNNDQYFISKCWSENNIKTFINAAIGMNYSIEKMH